MEIKQAILGRRSIRKYKPDEVKEEDLKEIFQAVSFAPSWANTQCWRFIVVKDKETKEKLASTLSPKNPATGAFSEAPIIIVACAKKQVSGFYKGQPTTSKGDWLMFDLGCAMQNLCLAAYSKGLGTVIVGLFNSEKAKEILSLPEEIEVVVMTPLGYPLQEGVIPPRKRFEEIVFFEKM